MNEVPSHYKDQPIRCESCRSYFQASKTLPVSTRLQSKGKKFYAILSVAFVFLLGCAAIVHYIKSAERKQHTELEREQQKASELEEKIALLEQQYELQDSSKNQQWDVLLEKIVIKLERDRKENINFRSSRDETSSSTEETRILTILREQESEALSIALELKAQGFPNHRKLEELIKQFSRNYRMYVSYALDSPDITGAREQVGFGLKTNEALQSISALKSE